jgi:nucleotide-binding universal stress UspA family protein
VEKVAMHAPCSVLVARDLERGHGHLLCTDGSPESLKMVKRSGVISKRINSALSVMSVSRDTEGEPEAQKNVNLAVSELKKMDINVVNAFTRLGNPFEEIISAGNDYSFIVVGSTGKTSLERFLMGSVSFKVMEYAKNSVIIVR